MKKCLICRKETSIWKMYDFLTSYFDNDTKEKYCLCNKCINKLSKAGAFEKGFAKDVSKSIRTAIWNMYENGTISPDDMNIITTDTITTIARKFLSSTNPTFGVWLRDSYMVSDVDLNKLLIDNVIVNVSDIESMQIMDNMIEYDIHSPETREYAFNTHHGLRRTISGGLLAGPVGAFMGGATSKHTINIIESEKRFCKTKEHDYTILLKLKTFLKGGSIPIYIGNDDIVLNILVNFFNKIGIITSK